MKNLKRTLQSVLILISIILTVACSTQTRTNNWEPDAGELSETLNLFFDDASSSNDNNLVQSTKADLLPEGDAQEEAAASAPTKLIYYAESGKTGLPLSVAGILDFSILGLPVASLYNVAEAKVLLMDTFVSKNREFTLIVSVRFIEPDGSVSNFQTAAFKTGSYKFTDEQLTLSFEKFDLTTFDLSDVEEDLGSVIQLKVTDKSGVEYGQFSSLVGFGN